MRVVDASACLNGSKTEPTKSAGIPGPVSVTDSSTRLLVRRSARCTAPPSGVNLIAFESRFQTICCSRAPSAYSAPTDGSALTAIWMRFASATDWMTSIAARMMSCMSTGARERRSLPDMMRATSSRSSISCDCRRAPS